jgi:hypothetical protein
MALERAAFAFEEAVRIRSIIWGELVTFEPCQNRPWEASACLMVSA